MHIADQLQRIFKVLIRLTGETHDKVTRQQQIRARSADTFNDTQIAFGGMLAVHRLQNPVRARLHRQMQIRHQLVTCAMRFD